MRPARIEVEIEELVLHGFPPLDRHAVAAATETGLVRLFGEGVLDVAPANVEAVVHDAGELGPAAGRLEHPVGAGVARAVLRATLDAAGQRRSR